MMQPFNLKPLCLPSVSSIRGFVGICKQIPSLPSELYVSIHLFPCIFISVLCIYITAEYDAAVPEAEREQLKGGAFEGVLGAAQEAIVISPWIAIAVRPKPGVWEYLRVDVSKLAVEELSVLEYLQFKEQLVEGRLRPSYHSGTGASGVRVVEVHPSSSTRNSPTALRSPWLWRG